MSKLVVKIRWIFYYINTVIFVFLLPSFYRTFLSKGWTDVWKSARIFATNGLNIFNIKIEIYNPYNIDLNQHYIIVANHRSWFDQLALIKALSRPFHILSKKEYFDIPLFGRGMKKLECVPVDEKTLTMSQFEMVVSFLDRSENLLVFIEGTRGEGREMLPFMPGAFKFSSLTQTPILPIHIIGSEEILSKKNPLSSIKSGKIFLFIEPPRIMPKKGYLQAVNQFEFEFRQKNVQLYDQHLGMNEGSR